MKIDLYAEYNKRTGGNITPPKKMVICAASETKFKMGESVDEKPKVKKGQVKSEMSHIATSNFIFGDVPKMEELVVKPARVPGSEAAVTSKIEFGKSEPEVIRVRKSQVPSQIAHVASTKLAFGDRNVPTDADTAKASKKQTAPGLNSAADHITFGEATELPTPDSAVKCGVLHTFENTEKNMVPSAVKMKAAKGTIHQGTSINMAKSLTTTYQQDPTTTTTCTTTSSEIDSSTPIELPSTTSTTSTSIVPNTPNKAIITRMPVGGNTTITFGDSYTPAKASSQTCIFQDIDVKTTVPVIVTHTSRNMQSSCFEFGAQPPKDRRSKKEVENVCPNEVPLVLETTGLKPVEHTSLSPPRSAKKVTVHSNKETLSSIFSTDGPAKETPSRSAKKTITPATVFGFDNVRESSTPIREKLMPTQPKTAAGAKPKPLEPVVKARGPVGGQVSVIFG